MLPSTEISRDQLEKEAFDGFRARFGAPPHFIVTAPGRVNLIGEHTDYNGGYVFPAAINKATTIASAPRRDENLHIYSENLHAERRLSLREQVSQPHGQWSDYISGVASLLTGGGHSLHGADLYIQGNIPRGAGLSSSASLEMAAAYTFMALNNFHVPELEIIRLCQRAEHEFVGVRCGIMDQFITCLGRSRHALFLDCRTLEYRYLPFPENLRLVIIDTGVKRALASSSYNLRREECAAAARGLSAALPSVQELRDVTPEEFDRHEGLLPPVIRKRCKHVVTENARVLRAVESLRTGNIPEFGKLMYDSHLSLQHDYEVSCPELDALVDICAEASGVYGARMTGAGFGGCAISLVEEKSVAELLARIEREYPMKTGKTPAVYVCTFEDGVALRGTGV